MNNKQFESFLNTAIGIWEKALWGMYVKPLVSVIDIVEKIERGEQVPSNYVEKMTDSVNYYLLLWGMLEDRAQREEEWR